MLTSTGSISLIERATTGNVEETERARERRRTGGRDCVRESANTQSKNSRCLVSNLSGNTSECDSSINNTSHLASVSPPQAAAGLGGGNGDNGRGAGDTVASGLAEEGP